MELSRTNRPVTPARRVVGPRTAAARTPVMARPRPEDVTRAPRTPMLWRAAQHSTTAHEATQCLPVPNRHPAMPTALLLLVHLLSIIVWLGGMAFAHFCLRPALPLLAPPERLRLVHAVLSRFLSWVLGAALLALASGLAIMAIAGGAGASMPWGWHAMAALGLVMIAVFAYVRLGPFQRLARAVAAQDWPAGASALAGVRQGVALNLAIGVLVVGVAVLGR